MSDEPETCKYCKKNSFQGYAERRIKHEESCSYKYDIFWCAYCGGEWRKKDSIESHEPCCQGRSKKRGFY
jgi:hypothetical protein